MSSKVALCNYALTKLGAARITSLSDNSPQAKACNAIFEDVAQCVMAESTFASTIRRADLNQTTTTPAFGYTYEYQLPTNPLCLRVIKLDETVPGDKTYEIEGDKLLISDATCSIQYVGYLTDSETYGPFLSKAIIYKLAAELALTIAGKNPEPYFAMYEAYAQKMRTMDSLQGSSLITHTSGLEDVR